MQGGTTMRGAWVPFALCALLTAGASAYVWHAEREAERARFDNAVRSVRDRIDERMASYMGLLRGAAGMMAHSSTLTPDEFRLFVARLKLREHYPGTQGIGYTARLGALSVEDATARAHAAGWNVRVWPATPRDEVHAIVMLEPLDARNRAALGFDMRTEPIRREAMDRARDHGEIALSGKVTLVQEIDEAKQAGFLLYSPVYAGGAIPATVEDRRAKLEGYVYSPLRAGDLLEGIFGAERPTLAFELYDGSTLADASRLYTFGRRIAPDEEAAVDTFPIDGHAWTARFVPLSSSGTSLLRALQVAALGALLSVVVLVVTRARERARAREVRAQAAVLASEETLRLKEMFIGMLGHDLRNPLSAIELSTELLTARLASDADGLAKLTRVRSSAERMARMIEQMLDLTRARLDGGIPVSPKPIDLDAIVGDVVDELVRGSGGGPIDVEARGELRGAWDPDRLAQVVSNLVGNALRHREGAPVRVTLDGTALHRVVLQVHNAGVIPAPLLPVVFEPFRSSTPGAKGRTLGLGLGLYITRAIVLAHGGSIDVVSRAGAGTTFTVSLPRLPGPLAREPRAQPAQLARA